MTTMYDSVDPYAIPAGAPAVAGYIDGAYRWSNEGWSRFGQTPKLFITVFGSAAGDVIDVETGDATPDQAVAWVVSQRNAGVADPGVYCSASRWPTVRATFDAHLVTEPWYWIADYTGSPTPIPGAAAHQYINPPASGGHYDLSVISDTLFELIGGTVALTQTDADLIASTLLNWWITTPNKPTGSTGRQVFDVLGDAERTQTLVSIVTGNLAADQAALLTAINAMASVDPAALAEHLSGPLAAALAPLLPADTTPAQFLTALATQLDKP